MIETHQCSRIISKNNNYEITKMDIGEDSEKRNKSYLKIYLIYIKTYMLMSMCQIQVDMEILAI